jgi:hypothetical protein
VSVVRRTLATIGINAPSVIQTRHGCNRKVTFLMRTFAAPFVVLVGLVLVARESAAAEFRTTQCAKYGQPEISFEVKSESIPAADRQWLIESLESMVASGSRFKPGETVQLGWMVDRIEKGPDETLRLQEPDMRSMPIAFVDSVDNTLMQLRAQKDTAESFAEKISPAFPSLREAILVPPRYLMGPVFSLERHAPEDSDSGWVMVSRGHVPGKDEFANYRRMSLYEFALAQPSLIHLLALPPGTVVNEDRDGTRSYFFSDKPLTLRADSYLQQLDVKSHQRAYQRKVVSHMMNLWKIPKGAPVGARCTGILKLSPAGEITGFQFADCPEDTTLRDSIRAAVAKSSPVPAPSQPTDYVEAVGIVFTVAE